MSADYSRCAESLRCLLVVQFVMHLPHSHPRVATLEASIYSSQSLFFFFFFGGSTVHGDRGVARWVEDGVNWTDQGPREARAAVNCVVAREQRQRCLGRPPCTRQGDVVPVNTERLSKLMVRTSAAAETPVLSTP